MASLRATRWHPSSHLSHPRPAPTDRRGLAAIGPRASNSSGTLARFFLPSSGSGRFATRNDGSTYALFKHGLCTTCPHFVCSSPVWGPRSCSATHAASSMGITTTKTSTPRFTKKKEKIGGGGGRAATKSKTFASCDNEGGKIVLRVPKLHVPTPRKGPNPERAELLYKVPCGEPPRGVEQEVE